MDFLNALTVASPHVQSTVQAALDAGCHGHSHFPFGDPVSIERCHLAIVRDKAYYVADKSDGVRVAIVFARSGDLFCAACVDRVGTVRALPVTADEALFDGTVLDAELVCTHANVFTFVVFDAACIAGNGSIGFALLHERLAACTAALATAHINGAPLRVKRMFRVAAANQAAFEAYSAALDYATDGVILTPDDSVALRSGVRVGIPPPTLKVKACHTMDFQWANNDLWFSDADERFPVRTLGLCFFADELCYVPFGVIVEMAPASFIRPDGTRELHFVQVRPDKKAPNAKRTVQRTLVSIIDAITVEDVWKLVAQQE